MSGKRRSGRGRPTRSQPPVKPRPPAKRRPPVAAQRPEGWFRRHWKPLAAPTSGCHYSLGSGTAPISPGVYDKHVDPEDWVHNLEHGYIVVLYNCPAGCASDIATLTRWYDGHAPDPALPSQKKIVVIPWTSMPTPFAVESWDWYLPLPTADTTKIEAFYQNHIDQSPEGNQTP